MAEKKRNNPRDTTVININKDDLEPFNELRAKETGRKGKVVSQNEFLKTLLDFYMAAKTGKIEEADLCDLILRHAHALTCYNCGALLEEKCNPQQNDTVGVMHIDPGSNNYPREPDEHAELYFECNGCSKERQARKTT